jgi:ribonucleotide monophosphatase NagD (HAD superfamily)
MDIVVSSLKKTWILDLDGTLLKHNGYLRGGDALLDGAKEFMDRISGDAIVLLTARSEALRERTVDFLLESGIRFDHIIFGMPVGERILINDAKPSGMTTALAFCKERDAPVPYSVVEDPRI